MTASTRLWVASLVLATVWPHSLCAEVYKLVDPETGKVTYTDNPPTTQPSKKVDLPAVNTQLATPPAEKNLKPSTTPTTSYEAVQVLQPVQDATIPPGQLNLIIQVETRPALQENHLLRILYDGKPLAPPASSTSFVINELVRGSHQIKAQILDSEGNVLKESKTITIHIKRGSAKFKPG